MRGDAFVASVSFWVEQQINVLGTLLVVIQDAEVVFSFVVVGPFLEVQLRLIADTRVQVAQLSIKVGIAIRWLAFLAVL